MNVMNVMEFKMKKYFILKYFYRKTLKKTVKSIEILGQHPSDGVLE